MLTNRCGMVYVDSEEIKWMPYVKSWAERIKEKLAPDMIELLLSLFELAVEKGFIYIKKNCDYAIHQVGVII